jgi:mono/diheme cytochrome c family protein
MPKKIFKFLGYLVLAVIVLAGLGLAWLSLRKPAMVPASSIKVAMTPERIARGQYIFESVADCGGCHSQRDFTRFGGPEVSLGLGRGTVLSDLVPDLPGVVVASNITPDLETGIGSWTDGEKIRAIRDGVSRDGRALFPMMPYAGYSHLSDDDIQALVAYLDSLPPIHNPLPKTKLTFPVGLFIKSVPKPAGSVPTFTSIDRVKLGEYQATVSGCGDCHTPVNKQGQPLAGKLLAGGRVFATPMGTVVASNITPDKDTGIGLWSEEFFLKRFADYQSYADGTSPAPAGPQSFTLMPWLGFSHRKPAELAAIYAYLRTIPPVTNQITPHPASAPH